MSIEQIEIKWYKAQESNDQPTNGGRLSPNVSTSNVKNNVWPDVPESERTAGSTKYRKLFIKIDDIEDLTLQDSKVFVEHHTEADDSVAIFPATQTDTQTDLSGTERLYGCGQLAADVAPAVASITVATEDVLYNMFRNGDKIRISDKTDINDNGGSEEYVTINGVPSYAGDVATIAITPVLSAAYAAANTRVSSVIEVGDIGTVVTAASVTSASTGAYDDTTYPIALSNVGCIEQDWTLTFTDATSFTVSGSVVGAIDTGTTSTQTVPVNPDFSQPYFTLEANGFSGGFLAGDTITFTTSPAAYPIWYRRDVPAASASLAANSVTIVVDGEST